MTVPAWCWSVLAVVLMVANILIPSWLNFRTNNINRDFAYAMSAWAILAFWSGFVIWRMWS